MAWYYSRFQTNVDTNKLLLHLRQQLDDSGLYDKNAVYEEGTEEKPDGVIIDLSAERSNECVMFALGVLSRNVGLGKNVESS